MVAPMATAQLTPAAVGIRKVLIATDLSASSNVALDFGMELAHGYGAEVDVVLVVPADEFLLAGPEAYLAAKAAARRDLAELKDDLLKKRSYREGEDYRLFLLEGTVAPAILDFAQRENNDLIVLGTHGRSGLSKVLMGSVAERVFRQSPVPVMTIGPQIGRPGGRAPKNILVAVDFTPSSEAAAHYAAAIAQQRAARLTLVHVIERWPAEAQADRARILQALRQKLAGLIAGEVRGLSCSYRVEVGHVVDTILYTANGIEADLLVMGARPPGSFLGRVVWPHTYEIVRQASCPVLTVRATDSPHDVNG
jgi:nucleotide-binding universal stress UspA family protein